MLSNLGGYVVSSRLLLVLAVLFISRVNLVRSGDAEALLALKSEIDPLNSLNWLGSGVCRWQGVKECINGRVSKLVLEHLNLSGTINDGILSQLDQLRVLSFKGNLISGRIPGLSGLVNLRSLYLNDNSFAGEIPSSFLELNHLKVIALAGNRLSGTIPESFLRLGRLYALYLQDNSFTGTIPPFDQASLTFFNVSNNRLSGPIPTTPTLMRFNASSFSGNINLCGEQVHVLCSSSGMPLGPSISPAYPPILPSSKGSERKAKLINIILETVGGLVLFIIVFGSWMVWKSRDKSKALGEARAEEGEARGEESKSAAAEGEEESSRNRGANAGKQGGPLLRGEQQEAGGLVFLGAGDQRMSYGIKDLLDASADMLGRGTVGSTFKVEITTEYKAAVKRLRDTNYPSIDDFRRKMDVLGQLRHPNLVPLRAYFQSDEERLLVYDYFPYGSLFALIHGTSGGEKPLHWTACLKIAEDVAAGLLYIHQDRGLTHGNLKSSNVLLGPDFEACLTDYGLFSFPDMNTPEESSSFLLFYRAPECRDNHEPITQEADVYSFGALLLELLTGKMPFQDHVQEHGSDLPGWVWSVREEETESTGDSALGRDVYEEKLETLLSIMMACLSPDPNNRPSMREVLKMIRDSRTGSHASSNHSEHL
ncbi:inactive leucine-rich repeat receptor-like serine/threonine-protein kinase At1g60630 [Eucalyptus grandis]|uniref:inactive leucine-rich repeat receptor-like serine/threonine-protein kinase At1g60630 n=1 Tax=Eucalyptus grandis TaxID=71139 RepID=UPI00192E7849|nr:inactive leucine-rich repeat receptor-like serine/threonine-protein kinase At1g60630 [Eucalyptus grandis]